MNTSNFSLPGWPGRVGVYLTSGGTQLSEFRPGEADSIEISPGEMLTLPVETRYNHLRWKDEEGNYYGDLSIYHSRGLYSVIIEVTNRVSQCLRWEKRNNFAQSENSL